MEDIVTIKTMLIKIMQYNGWTQQELCDRMKFQKSQVSRWLNKSQIPRTDTYIMIKNKYDEIPEAFA